MKTDWVYDQPNNQIVPPFHRHEFRVWDRTSFCRNIERQAKTPTLLGTPQIPIKKNSVLELYKYYFSVLVRRRKPLTASKNSPQTAKHRKQAQETRPTDLHLSSLEENMTCEDPYEIVRLHAFTAEYLCRIFIAFYSTPRQNPCSHTISASLIHTPDMTSQQVFGVYIHVVLLPLMEQQRTIQFSCTVQQ